MDTLSASIITVKLKHLVVESCPTQFAVNFSIFQIWRGTFYKRINKNKIKQMPNPTNPSRSVRKKSRNQGDSKCAKSPVPPPARPLRFKKINSVNFYLGKNSTTRGPVPAWYNC